MRPQTVREAIAAALGNLDRDPTVFAYGPGGGTGDIITVIPADEYIAQETIGQQSYGMLLQFDLRIEVPGLEQDSQIAMDDYLSTGTGSTSSVVDAILVDSRLGGAVEDGWLLGVDGPDLSVDPITALVHFRFMVARG